MRKIIFPTMIFLATCFLVDLGHAQRNLFDDIVGMGIRGSDDHVYTFFRTGNYSSGTSSKLGRYLNAEPYHVPMIDGILYTPSDIVGVAMAGSNDWLYIWLKDGVVLRKPSRRHIGKPTHVAWPHWRTWSRHLIYNVPRGKFYNDIVGMGIAGSNDYVYTWFRDGTVCYGTSRHLHKYRKPYTYFLPYSY